ncbi:hypothetical protein ACFVR1_12595 [Psychrobacillus sp. NPDC058041]|uniref:hypothetical protein n=1 Tax=Psychrobacillus sp. NPDC058041 TaxID=3346310 RepID=UPI0036DE94E6
MFEAKIDKEIEINPDDLLAKRNNFRVDINNIKLVQVNEKPSFHTAWNDNGSVQITLKDGKKLKFIIPVSVLEKSIIETFKSQNLPLQNSF